MMERLLGHRRLGQNALFCNIDGFVAGLRGGPCGCLGVERDVETKCAMRCSVLDSALTESSSS
jgi:hypothetical protein